MVFAKISDRALCATWFGGLALILILPLCVTRVLNFIEYWREGYADFTVYPDPAYAVYYAFAVYLEGLVPVGAAAFFGSRLGVRICSQESQLSNFASFILGVKISATAAVAWVVVGVLSTLVGGVFFDTSRFAAGIFVLALFGFPIYGGLAGFGGLALRRLVIGRGITKDGSGQKTT